LLSHITVIIPDFDSGYQRSIRWGAAT
jgi:hypothetical protein